MSKEEGGIRKEGKEKGEEGRSGRRRMRTLSTKFTHSSIVWIMLGISFIFL